MSKSSADLLEGIMPGFGDRLDNRSTCSSISSGSPKFRGHKVEYSHKLTEKRRRDRMNTSMSEIAQLLPSSSVSKQLEKAEILEKTITYIKKLQEITGKQELKTGIKPGDSRPQGNQDETIKDGQQPTGQTEVTPNYYSGFRDCIKEVFHCLTNVEAMDLQQPCFQRLMGHLQNELQFMSENEEASESEPDHQGNNPQKKYPSTTSNGGMDSLLSSKGPHTTWGYKRSHESIESTATQQEASSSDTQAKRPHIDNSTECNENTLYGQESENSNSSNLYPRESPSSIGSSGHSSKKEKMKTSLGSGNFWVGNGSPYSNAESCNAGLEKEKGEGLSSSNIFDKANMDGSGCVNEGVGGNLKWLNNGVDMPIVATPISPRTPYIPNPYTMPTYALHPSGTHYIPVVLHFNIPLPPLPEMNGRLNSGPNMAALNYTRMGGLQYPYFPYVMPFVPPIPSSITGMNGVCKPKQEPTQKQCESNPREVDSSTTDL